MSDPETCGMEAVLRVIGWWFLISIPAGILFGKFLKWRRND